MRNYKKDGRPKNQWEERSNERPFKLKGFASTPQAFLLIGTDGPETS